VKSKIDINLDQITVIYSGDRGQCSNKRWGHLLKVLQYWTDSAKNSYRVTLSIHPSIHPSLFAQNFQVIHNKESRHCDDLVSYHFIQLPLVCLNYLT